MALAFCPASYLALIQILATGFLTSTKPTLQGKAVFLMPIRQADAPNHCSIANKAVYETCMVLAKLTMPFGCSAALCSLSHCLQLIRHSSRQLLCTSCHLIHFVLRSASFHHVRSLTICCKVWHTIHHTKYSTSDAHTFSQA